MRLCNSIMKNLSEHELKHVLALIFSTNIVHMKSECERCQLGNCAVINTLTTQ